MVTRIWRGWTAPHNAQVYQDLLLAEIFPGIAKRGVPGYRGVSLARRDLGDQVEFVTTMWFDSIGAVKAFAGPEYEIAVVPPAAREVLERFDERCAHYETIVPPPAGFP